MKQFDLDKYLKNPNRKVVTRDGKSVRIVCTDMMGTSYPILAICRVDPTHDCYYSYTINGKHNLGADSRLDLFFAPEKHESWINLLRNSCGEIFISSTYPYEDEKTAKWETSSRSNVVATCKITWEE